MILDSFPTVLWINLDRSVYRKQYMETLLAVYNLKNVRIGAIEGVSTNKEYSYRCLPSAQISTVENACTCSHLKALQYFVHQMTENEIIIFEDDVCFDFLTYIPNNWSHFMLTLPPNYGIVQLAVSSETLVSVNLTEMKPHSNRYCTTAYLITREKAMELLQKYTANNVYQLSTLGRNALADKLLYSLGPVYSIPIFSYCCLTSTIHPSHLQMHKKSKLSQLLQWKLKYIQKSTQAIL